MSHGVVFDVLEEMAPANIMYTLTVRDPPRPAPKWLPSVVARKPVNHAKHGTPAGTIPRENTNPNRDCFELKHLNDDDIGLKTVKIKAKHFPVGMRCGHLKDSKVCDQKCYVFEKGGRCFRKKCSRDDCQGHVYVSAVMEDAHGRSCFGKKGHRYLS
jgi:hypothetical protein